MPITSGVSAPEFSLPDETGKVRRLSDYRGHTVVLYFYPKDDTPGCTTEACNFRDDYSAFIRADVIILGVSPDTTK
ncbi:MAG: peroxiredoxin, partial [Chloroflexota bacterium]